MELYNCIRQRMPHQRHYSMTLCMSLRTISSPWTMCVLRKSLHGSPHVLMTPSSTCLTTKSNSFVDPFLVVTPALSQSVYSTNTRTSFYQQEQTISLWFGMFARTKSFKSCWHIQSLSQVSMYHLIVRWSWQQHTMDMWGYGTCIEPHVSRLWWLRVEARVQFRHASWRLIRSTSSSPIWTDN